MKMLKCLSLGLLLLLSSVSQAIPLRLDATTMDFTNGASVSDFSIIFADGGDGLLQIDEIISFSGVTILSTGVEFNTVLLTPFIPGISTGTTNPAIWGFVASNGNGLNATQEVWNYSVTSVPEPATILLFSLGLLGLTLTKHRNTL